MVGPWAAQVNELQRSRLARHRWREITTVLIPAEISSLHLHHFRCSVQGDSLST
jgi:hypothetical protein